MCGIAGILSITGDHRPLAHISRMTDAMHRRGPDDEGVAVFQRRARELRVFGGPDSPRSLYDIDGRMLVTDCYTTESMASADGITPLRLIDLQNNSEREILRINTKPRDQGANRIWRVDPHPAWDRPFQRVTFNACPDGTRRVYIADLAEMV